jgi:predicted phosphodiesterase
MNPWPIDWPEAEVLIIAGDTANDFDTGLELIREASEVYPHVIMVDGNHDHWYKKTETTTIEDNIRDILPKLPSNVQFLGHHNPSFTHNGIKFIGVNGWYSVDYSGDPGRMRRNFFTSWSDGKYIFSEPNQLDPWYRAKEDADLIIKELSEVDPYTACVVVTHTVPHRDCIRSGPEWAAENNYFFNSYMEKIIESDLADRITLWVFGHTHDRMEKIRNDVVLHANPRGQRKENPNWFVTTFDIIG